MGHTRLEDQLSSGCVQASGGPQVQLPQATGGDPSTSGQASTSSAVALPATASSAAEAQSSPRRRLPPIGLLMPVTGFSTEFVPASTLQRGGGRGGRGHGSPRRPDSLGPIRSPRGHRRGGYGHQ